MGEIAMPTISPELMAAVNSFGGSGDVAPLSAENGSQGGSFDAVLGLLMANSAQMQVQAVPEQAEAEASPELTAADILSAALEGENAEIMSYLSQVFTENGAKAFTETLSRMLPEYDGEELPEDTLSIWKDISPEEKKAFAELLYAAADFSENESNEIEKSPEDMVRIICRIVAGSVRKSDKKVSETPKITDEAAVIQGMSIFRPLQTAADIEVSEAAKLPEGVITDEAVTMKYPETDKVQAAEVKVPVQTDNAAQAETADHITADIQTAYEKLSEANPEDIAGFCRKLADELNASVKEAAPETDTAPENADNGHIEFGRQGMQSFMARVNRHEELSFDENVQIVPGQAENTAAVNDIPLERAVPEEDISSQIMRQIDLYEDIFGENFSEKEISMKLSPESLGGVEIRIKKSEKGFEITFTAEKAEAAQLITDKASELREALASRGIALKELSVTRQIVTSESDGSLTGETPFGNGDLYGSTQNGQSQSDRHFSFGGQNSSDSEEQTDEGSSEQNYNREAKLWVSA